MGLLEFEIYADASNQFYGMPTRGKEDAVDEDGEKAEAKEEDEGEWE
jgi:hypothetical protein